MVWTVIWDKVVADYTAGDQRRRQEQSAQWSVKALSKRYQSGIM